LRPTASQGVPDTLEIIPIGMQSWAMDYSTPPGCFDIVARGPGPRISFHTDVTAN
jgi:hypothetical protein